MDIKLRSHCVQVHVSVRYKWRTRSILVTSSMPSLLTTFSMLLTGSVIESHEYRVMLYLFYFFFKWRIRDFSGESVGLLIGGATEDESGVDITFATPSNRSGIS